MRTITLLVSSMVRLHQPDSWLNNSTDVPNYAVYYHNHPFITTIIIVLLQFAYLCIQLNWIVRALVIYKWLYTHTTLLLYVFVLLSVVVRKFTCSFFFRSHTLHSWILYCASTMWNHIDLRLFTIIVFINVLDKSTRNQCTLCQVLHVSDFVLLNLSSKFLIYHPNIGTRYGFEFV